MAGSLRGGPKPKTPTQISNEQPAPVSSSSTINRSKGGATSTGKNMVRLSDPDGPVVSYSSSPAFNLDSTRFFASVNGIPTLYKFDPKSLTIENGGQLFDSIQLRFDTCYWSATESNILIGLAESHAETQLYSFDVDTKTYTLIKDLTAIISGRAGWMKKSLTDDSNFTFGVRESELIPWRAVTFNRDSDIVDTLNAAAGEQFNSTSAQNVEALSAGSTAWQHQSVTSTNRFAYIGGYPGEAIASGWEASDSQVYVKGFTAGESVNFVHWKGQELSSSDVREVGPGQWFYDEAGNSLYLRLPDDSNPNVGGRSGAPVVGDWRRFSGEVIRVSKRKDARAERLVQGSGEWVEASHFRGSVSRDGRFVIFNATGSSSADTFVASLKSETLSAAAVDWTDLVNVSASGGSLQKSSGGKKVDDGRANSVQVLASGDGYVEFQARETTKERMVGLTNVEKLPSKSGEVRFGIYLTRKGKLQIRENGVTRKSGKYQGGDIFRIAIEAETVKYYQRDSLLYVSEMEPSYPMMASAAMIDLGGTVTSTSMAGAFPGIIVTVRPDKATLETGQTQQFSASVKGSKDNRVSWSANGGSISSSGFYTSPNTAGQYRVTATHVGSPEYSGFATAYVSSGSDSTPPSISGVGSSNITTGSATVNWNTNEASDTQVEYGLTTSYGSSSSLNSNMVTGHSVNLTGLQSGRTYNFRVKSRDAAGNLATSGNFTFSTSDNSAPVISAVTATSITGSAATITWTTNEASNTQVEYGPTTAYGSSTTLNTSMVTSHSQGLSGLSGGTLYHYRVKSRDGSGNLATSGDFTFTTTDTVAPVISAVTASNITASSATVTWTTNEPSDTQVNYGTSSSYGSSTSLNTTMVTNHSATITGLTANRLYHYRARSRDAAGNLRLSSDFTFTTTSAADTTPPSISGVAASSITTSGATITWTTNEASNTQVEYGTTTSYGSSTSINATMVTSHNDSLSGLSAGTTYNYRVKSRDAAGNLATSGNFTFTTSAPPPPPPPSSSLVTAYALNEGSGSTAADASGSGMTGTVTSASWNSQGRFGGALTFDGSSSKVRSSSLTLPTSFTLMAWVSNPSNSPYETIVSVGPDRDFHLSNGVIAFYSDSIGNWVFGSAIANNTWQHVALTYDGTNLRAYLNGTLRGSAQAAALPSTSGIVQVGAFSNGTDSDFFSGVIDEVRVYNRTLSQSEITNDMNSPLAGGSPPPADTAPPVISGVGSSGITSSGANISWTTNEASDTQVEYGTTTSYGSSTSVNPSMVTGHGVSLNGLQSSRLYNYRVKSRDAAGNLATSGNFTFTTSATADTTPPTISAIAASAITSSGATISWTTNESSDTQVEYGTTTSYGSSTTLNPSMVTGHSASLSGLQSNRLYNYRVKSRDAAGNLATSANFTFTTSSTADTVAPVISAVVSSAITSVAATVSWTTNEPSDTQVVYGATTSYGSSTVLDVTLGTSHLAVLGVLTPSTLYHYRVRSRDAAGNLATSADFTFTTSALLDLTPPVISGVTASGITNSSATIAWTTNEGSNTQVNYGTTTSYGSSTSLNTTMVTSHSASLSGLSANTLYHYRVRSTDAAGNLAVSSDFTFTTSSGSTSCPGFVIEGFGRNTVGGCGGTIITVTNLNDSGAGSFRNAVQQSGRRIVRFAVSGWITLNTRVMIENPYLTIDGSDAPNGGVGLRGDGIDLIAHDVIIRNIRMRSDTWATDDPLQIVANDGVEAYNVVLDHVSITAGQDGNVDVTNGAHDITIQHSIIAENNGSGATLQRYNNTTRVTYYRNLFANNPSNRNPTIHSGDVDMVNNVIYRNVNGHSFENLTAVGPDVACRVNYVGNYFKKGSSESIAGGDSKEIYLFGGEAGSSQSMIHLQGNISPTRPNDTMSQTTLVYAYNGGLPISGSRHNFPAVPTVSAATAYNDVLQNVGAIMPCRDAIDRRIIDYVTNGTGATVWGGQDPGQLGGWPNLSQPCGSVGQSMEPQSIETDSLRADQLASTETVETPVFGHSVEPTVHIGLSGSESTGLVVDSSIELTRRVRPEIWLPRERRKEDATERRAFVALLNRQSSRSGNYSR
jgi:hypothetical protein